MKTSLVVAIEPDRDQAARLSGIVRGRLGAELVLAESVARALATIGDRIPDLILTPALLSTRDEAALSARLRDLGAAAAHVQTVTVPRIGGAVAESGGSGIFKRFRKSRPAASAPDGCEPDVFAQQVSAYLQRARAERAATIAPAVVQPVAVVAEPIPEPAIEGFVELPHEELFAAPPIEEPVVAPPFEQLVVAPPLEELVVEPPLEELIVAPSFEAIEPEPITFAEPEPIALLEPEPIALAEPIVLAEPEPILVTSDPLVEEIIALPVAQEFVVAPQPVEAVIEPPWVIEELAAAPSLVQEEDFVPQVSEESVAASPVVEEYVEPVAVAASEPLFSVDDIELEFWIADEPEPAPLEAAAMSETESESDRFDIAAQDFGDIDMSSLLDGLVLPEVTVLDVPTQKAPTATVIPEPEAEAEAEPEPAPAPVASRRKPPAKRHVPVHERAPEPKAPPRRRGKSPVQDEWGLFDPEQCGFAALVSKLDAETEEDKRGKRRGTQTRVISYN